MLDEGSFFDRLSSAAPVPGGGSVAALEVAMAAALLVMVTNLTSGRKKYADVQDTIESLQQRALAMRDRGRHLAQADEAAYGEVAQVLALPRGTEAETLERRERLQLALKNAAGPPLDTMIAATEVMDIAVQTVRIGNRSAISDVGTAALAARAGYHAARLNVEINLAGIRDTAWEAQVREKMDGLTDPDAAEREVLGVCAQVIRGNPV